MASLLDQKIARALLDWIRAQRPAFVALIGELTQMESPTHDAGRQRPVLGRLAASFEESGLVVERRSGRSSGGQLVARPTSGSERGAQLLVGHCDTVWPAGTLAAMPLVIGQNRIAGPGVFDMKTGLAQIVVALQALRALKLQPALAPVVMINSDEETGSEESAELITALAQQSQRAFIMEPALGPAGKLKTARKGVGRFTVSVNGRAAHAGLDLESGVSAIQELAFVIQQLHALNGTTKGVTVNVGRVEGGLRPNVVAPSATAWVDARALTPEDAAGLEAAIRALQPTLPGAAIEVAGSFARPPLARTPANQTLWHKAQVAGRLLGLELTQGTAGGASDGNLTSLYTATLDGLGAVGDGAHAQHEHILIEQSLERAALLAALLLIT